MIDGTLALQISRDTVPDLATANIELDKIWDLIFSSEITWELDNELSFKNLTIMSLFSPVVWKIKKLWSTF